MINGNLTKANFSDKYKCDSILGKYQYGRSNSVVLNKAIEGYDKMSEEEQNKNIVEKFSYIKRAVPCSDEDLIKSIKDESLQLSQYEYLKDTPRYSDMTIELLARYDVVKMAKKSNWTMEDITKIFNERKKDILKRLYLYTGETETKSNKQDNKQEEKRAEKIYNRLCDNNTKKVIEKTPLVNFINDFFASEKQDYDCRVFFNDKPIYIYKNEFEEIKKISRKYRTNEKDGRRIVRLVCLLLAWQKAFQNQYYNHRLNGYARLKKYKNGKCSVKEQMYIRIFICLFAVLVLCILGAVIDFIVWIYPHMENILFISAVGLLLYEGGYLLWYFEIWAYGGVENDFKKYYPYIQNAIFTVVTDIYTALGVIKPPSKSAVASIGQKTFVKGNWVIYQYNLLLSDSGDTVNVDDVKQILQNELVRKSEERCFLAWQV